MVGTVPDVFLIVEGIALWLDPTPGTVVDRAWMRPSEYQPDTLYLYPEGDDQRPYDGEGSVRMDFRLVADYAVASAEQGGPRDPAVTETLRQRASAYAERVRRHQRTAVHDMLRVAGTRWLELVGTDYRGFRMRLEGYRLWD